MKRELDSGLLVLGLVTGVVMGGVVTLLYAPFNAAELRRRARRQLISITVPQDEPQPAPSLESGREPVRANRETAARSVNS